MIKIKKVITALLSEQINNELQKDDNIEVLAEDFLYQDAVLEYIEENEEIDFLLINEELPGEEIENFINKIKNIKIILFVNNSKNKEKLLNEKIYRIYTNGEIEIEELKNTIKEENYTQRLEEEIENLKKIIKENSEEKNSKKYSRKNNKNKLIKKEKIISIIGTNSLSKLLFILNQIKLKQNKKILLISFDWLNKELEKNILNNKIEIANINKFFFSKENNKEKIEKYINTIKKEYDYIFINHSIESFFEINKCILKKAEKIYLIVEENIKEIILANNLLKIYINIWKIKEEKIEIIVNKIQKNKITKKYKNKQIKKIPYKNNLKENIWI